jgi:hypothetical protein
MNDLSTAEDCYVTMLNTSMRERDGPLAARGHIGLALLQDMRGNLPASEVEYLRALELAVPMGATSISACQGLMSLAMTRGHLADALLYGWKLYDASENDLETRAGALGDLAGVALKAGFYDAALRGYEHVVNLVEVPRIRMVAVSGALRASARVGDIERVRRYDSELSIEIARANQPHTAAMVLVSAAEAWAAAGDSDAGRQRAREAIAISSRFGFNEYLFRAEALVAEFERGLPPSEDRIQEHAHARPERYSDPAIDRGIGRLETLSV